MSLASFCLVPSPPTRAKAHDSTHSHRGTMESFPPPAGPVALRDRLNERMRALMAALREQQRT